MVSITLTVTSLLTEADRPDDEVSRLSSLLDQGVRDLAPLLTVQMTEEQIGVEDARQGITRSFVFWDLLCFPAGLFDF